MHQQGGLTVTPTTVQFEKYHGTGNDFIIVDAETFTGDRRQFAQDHCDRESGVTVPGSDRPGADGVLFLTLDRGAQPHRVKMTLIQPDGSAAAMCGNGARCVAHWVYQRTDARECVIETPAGDRSAQIKPDGETVTIGMGTPRFDAESVPLARSAELVDEAAHTVVDTAESNLKITAVNTGVPHAVAFVEEVDSRDLAAGAEPIRHARVFPEGANVNLATEIASTELPESDSAPESGDDRVPVFQQRTFERGVEAETRSCGTGAVAIAAVAKRLGYTQGDRIRTRPPGGELTVRVPDRGSATLTGPVTRQFVGTLPEGQS
jgi:diaminopimelate epimerase